MSGTARDIAGRFELCCRECGEWKSMRAMDPTSVFRVPEDAPKDSLALTWDFNTPLCVECVGGTEEEDQGWF